MVRRFALLALLAASCASGCRAVGNGNQLRPDPLANRPSATAREVADQVNRNAQAIRSFRANAEVTAHSRRIVSAGSATGRMAMERPRNFRLQLNAPLHPDFADIGSNDRSFWFATSEDKQINIGEYDANGNVPSRVPLTMQPDWIIEALGLREISDDEIARTTVRDGRQPGTLVLTSRRQAGNGEAYIKDIVVDKATLQVLEHHLLAADRTPLAHAVIEKSQTLVDPEGTRVNFPRKIRLTWVREGFDLDAELERPVVNAADAFSAELFKVPEKPGYARQFLQEDKSLYARGPTSIRETRPAPPAGLRIDLEPLPDKDSTRAGFPVPLGADLPGLANPPEGVVGARLPSAPETPTGVDTTPSPGARRSYRPIGFER